MESSADEKEKEVAYYSACVNSWFATRMELDKSLLTLSAGGIGILVTVLSTAGLNSIASIILYILALVFFLVCLFVVLWILRENSEYLAKANCGHEPDEKLLKRLDTIASASFLIAVLFSSVIGISIAVDSFRLQEENMSTKKFGPVTHAQDSVQGVNRMQPVHMQNSYGGATSMKPKPSSAAPAAAPASTQPAASASTSQQAGQSTAKQ